MNNLNEAVSLEAIMLFPRATDYLTERKWCQAWDLPLSFWSKVV